MSMGAGPIVSVITANFRGAEHLEACAASVLGQSLRDLEWIVCDDGSPDASVAILRGLAARDPRVKVIEGPGGEGPAGARNRCLEIARGRWLAVVDSDDLIAPDRLERLTAEGERGGDDLVCDDLVLFAEDPTRPHGRLLDDAPDAPGPITAERWVRANRVFGRGPALGYLKPVIRAEALGPRRYDASLRVAEDFDLVARLLFDGARMRLVDEALYFYRRHAGSISHRLGETELRAMIAADAGLRAAAGGRRDWLQALDARRASLETALAFTRLVAAVKGRAPLAALGIAAGRPQALPLLALPLRARIDALRDRFGRSGRLTPAGATAPRAG